MANYDRARLNRSFSGINAAERSRHKAGGAAIKALDDSWLDTTTPHGELILTVMGGMAEFERKLIRQRCDEGIRRAKLLGKHLGRKQSSGLTNAAGLPSGTPMARHWPQSIGTMT